MATLKASDVQNQTEVDVEAADVITRHEAAEAHAEATTPAFGALVPATGVVDVSWVDQEGEVHTISSTVPLIWRHLPVVTSYEQLLEASMMRMVLSDDPEALFADPESDGLRDYSGRTIQLLSVDCVMPSTRRRGDWYVLMTVYDPVAKRKRTVTTGSPYAGGRASVAQLKGWLPRWVRPVELESSSTPGQSSLWLVDAVQPGEDGEAF